MSDNRAAIAQGLRIRDVVADVAAGMNCDWERALDLVAGVLIGLPESIDALGLAGEYVVLDVDLDEVEFRLRCIEGRFGGMAAQRVIDRGLAP